jgi:hypothetical protein
MNETVRAIFARAGFHLSRRPGNGPAFAPGLGRAVLTNGKMTPNQLL